MKILSINYPKKKEDEDYVQSLVANYNKENAAQEKELLLQMPHNSPYCTFKLNISRVIVFTTSLQLIYAFQNEH